MTAKYFQIPALGAMLVCTDTNGLDMFPEDTYISYSKDNIEKLHSDIMYHIKNKKETLDKVNTLTNYVLKNHNHKIRSFELISIIMGLSLVTRSIFIIM